MDTATSAAFARIDHWFELMQAQHVDTLRQLNDLRAEARAGLDELRADTRVGFEDLRSDLRKVQTTMEDGFISVDQRFASIERDVAALHTEVRAHGTAISGLSDRVLALTARIGGLEKGVGSMDGEMRQRFRTVIERLAVLERTP